MSSGEPGLHVRPYSPPRGVANATVLCLTISLLLYGLAFVSQLAEVSLLGRAETTGITFAEADANDQRQGLIAVAWAVLFLVTTVVFIVWFHRCYRNLTSLGVDRLRYSSGWAIGGWFLPIANYWIPKQIANDIWRGTEPTDDPRVIMSPSGPTPWFLTLWWISWIVVALLNIRVTFSFETPDAPTLDNLQRDSKLQLLNIAVWVASDILALKVVREITKRQEERAARLAHRQNQHP